MCFLFIPFYAYPVSFPKENVPIAANSHGQPKENIKHKNVIVFEADLWCPYNCNPNSNQPGYMVEILQKAFGAENVKYSVTNWARAVKHAQKGEIDGVIATTQTEAAGLIYSQMIGQYHDCFFTKNISKFHYTGVESLNGLILGIVKDYEYPSDVQKYIATHRKNIVEHFGDSPQEKMIQKLEANRLDVFMDDPNVIAYLLKKNGQISDFRQAECIETGDLYIGFSPQNAKVSLQRVEKLNATIEKMKKNGELVQLLQKYGVDSWKKEGRTSK